MHRYSTARLLAAGAALVLTASPAFAQDDGRGNYDGVYVAVSAGAAIQNNDRGDTVVFDTNRDGSFDNVVLRGAGGLSGADAFGPVPGATGAVGGFCNGLALGNSLAAGCSSDEDDKEYAVKIGLDGQLGSNWVAGVLLEGSTTNAKDFTTAFSVTPASYAFSRGLDYAISARGRFGYTPDGSGLFYVTGGPSYGKLDHDFASTNTANFGGAATTTPRAVAGVQRGGNKVWGYQFGGGAEYTLGNGLGIALEYLYSKYDDEDYFVFIPPSTTVNPGAPANAFGANGTNFRSSEQDFDFHSIRISLLYKFGRGGL